MEGGFELDAKACASDDMIRMHGVTYSEMMKIPLYLYAYTGKKDYLELALNAQRKMERDHMLPDGVQTSAEFTAGNDIDIAHETCDVTDYTWALGCFLAVTGDARWADRIEKAIFNAGPGAVTKDFGALQYFSCVNQVIATGSSDNNEYRRGKTWMQYRPVHETGCCAGVTDISSGWPFHLDVRCSGVILRTLPSPSSRPKLQLPSCPRNLLPFHQ